MGVRLTLLRTCSVQCHFGVIQCSCHFPEKTIFKTLLVPHYKAYKATFFAGGGHYKIWCGIFSILTLSWLCQQGLWNRNSSVTGLWHRIMFNLLQESLRILVVGFTGWYVCKFFYFWKKKEFSNFSRFSSVFVNMGPCAFLQKIPFSKRYGLQGFFFFF